MKSDYQYSASIVYNNFPWPNPNEIELKRIEKTARAVLDARSLYSDSSLADLYDPLSMPVELIKAHRYLDRAVKAAYGEQGYSTEAERVADLMVRYQELTLTK